MAIKKIEIEIDGIPHTVQVNDADTNAAPLGDRLVARAGAKHKEPENKARTPKNKAAKAAEKKLDLNVEDASDPGASE